MTAPLYVRKSLVGKALVRLELMRLARRIPAFMKGASAKSDSGKNEGGELARRRPALMRGYCSGVYELATASERLGADIRLKGVVLTSEMYTERQVDAISRAFRCGVYFEYGLSEVCACALSVGMGRDYLCSPVFGFVEVLGPSGRHVDEGEIGEIVATGFHNYGTPFVRYRTGDMAVYGGMANGVKRLRRILGREQDYILDAKGNRHYLTALIFGQHFKAFQRIKKWRVSQSAPGEVVIQIRSDSNLGDDEKAEIKEKISNSTGMDPVIEIVDAFETSRNGKFRFCVRK